jgi:hypothetical protein
MHRLLKKNILRECKNKNIHVQLDILCSLTRFHDKWTFLLDYVKKANFGVPKLLLTLFQNIRCFSFYETNIFRCLLVCRFEVNLYSKRHLYTFIL